MVPARTTHDSSRCCFSRCRPYRSTWTSLICRPETTRPGLFGCLVSRIVVIRLRKYSSTYTHMNIIIYARVIFMAMSGSFSTHEIIGPFHRVRDFQTFRSRFRYMSVLYCFSKLWFEYTNAHYRVCEHALLTVINSLTYTCANRATVGENVRRVPRLSSLSVIKTVQIAWNQWILNNSSASLTRL